MNKKMLLALIVATLALCAVAAILHQRKYAPGPTPAPRAPNAAVAQGRPLLGDLIERAPDVTQVEITKDDETLTLTREDDVWRLTSRGGYPADTKKINQLIFELTDLTVGDVITDQTDMHAAFGVEGDVGEDGALTLTDANGTRIAHLVCGAMRRVDPQSGSRARSGGRYFRLDDAPTVYLADAALYWVTPQLSAWVDPQILSLPAADIVSLTIERPSTEPLTLTWEHGVPTLDPMPEGATLKTAECSTVRGALSNLRLNDVRSNSPPTTPTSVTSAFNSTFTARSQDGTIYTVRLNEDGPKRWVRLSAAYGEPVLTDLDRATTQTLAAAEARAVEAESAVAAFNQRHAPWLYEIPTWSADRLLTTLDAFVERQ